MNKKNKITPAQYLESYLVGIPADILDIFVPETAREKYMLSKAIKRLRIREKERNYVMENQQHFSLPLRPNETLKKTMIRARLTILQNRLKRNKTSGSTSGGLSLPIDPLE